VSIFFKRLPLSEHVALCLRCFKYVYTRVDDIACSSETCLNVNATPAVTGTPWVLDKTFTISEWPLPKYSIMIE
jgi:hypothetical protein